MRSLRFKEKCCKVALADRPVIYWEEKGGDSGAEEESGTALSVFTLGWPSINIKDKSILYSAVVGHLGHIHMNKGCSTIAGKKDPDASAGTFRYSHFRNYAPPSFLP